MVSQQLLHQGCEKQLSYSPFPSVPPDAVDLKNLKVRCRMLSEHLFSNPEFLTLSRKENLVLVDSKKWNRLYLYLQ